MKKVQIQWLLGGKTANGSQKVNLILKITAIE